MYNITNDSEYECIGDTTHQILFNDNHDEVVRKIYGYKNDLSRRRLFVLSCILFMGIPYLISYWFPRFWVIQYKRCSLAVAEYILLKDTYGNYEIIKIEITDTYLPNLGQIILRYFYHQHTKYAFVQIEGIFVPLDMFIPSCSLNDILESSKGLNQFEQANLLDLYGYNKVEIEIKSYWKLFVEEVFNPFYIFQIFSMLLWAFDNYIIYAVCILVISLFSIVLSLIQTRKQSKALHDMVEASNVETVHIRRPCNTSGYKEYTIDSKYLVPGDVLIIPPTGCIMTCDAVLITGNCIVNESMLTGESVPVTKTPPHASPELFDSTIHKRHTLFSGTHVMQTRFYGGEHVLARVTRTGFDTTKGALVKSILYPTPVRLKLYSDSFKFIFVLFVVALVGIIYSTYLYILRHASVVDIIIRSLDIVTIVVPPALPAAMSIGTVYSQNRLKKLGIFSISPLRINICGKLKLTCFDKTGTLTQDGLEMYSAIPCTNARFGGSVTNLTEIDQRSFLIQAMATCHSLTRIDEKLIGDPLDMNMFESIHWELEEPGVKESARYDMVGPTIVKPQTKYCSNYMQDIDLPYEIGIVRQFPFSSSQQCMSVICRVLGDQQMIVFMKGAPEKVAALCQNNTLPVDFNDRLADITAQGFRVIALAYNYLPTSFKWKDAQKAKREQVEHNLIFVGLLIMQNTLKPESGPVISALHKANIRSVMITGDNIRTAIAVAHDCGMIKAHEEVIIITVANHSNEIIAPTISTEKVGAKYELANNIISIDNPDVHFAMDGKTWTNLKSHYPDLIPKLLLKTTVFARFQPDQKTQLILYFQKLDYIVSMVGDGANDCGALKAAHVGVSLSQAEASVAAPFTSSIDNISCILHIILEGRCALVTSFALFKYMAAYSIIQFFSVLILYSRGSTLADTQFLFIDLIIAATTTITLGRQGPHTKLVAKRPLGSLACMKSVIPLILQFILCGFIQIAALTYLSEQKWFEPLPTGHEVVIISWENTVIFCISSFQYLILGMLYSKGKPFREPLINNFWLLISSLSLTIFITFLLIYPIKPVANFFNIIYLIHHTHAQRYFRYHLLMFPIVHLILASFIEMCIAERIWLKKLVHIITWKKRPRNKYKLLLQETDFSRLLPPSQY